MNNKIEKMRKNYVVIEVPNIMDKLTGDNFVQIVICGIIAGTVCYICRNGGNLTIRHGETVISYTSDMKQIA